MKKAILILLFVGGLGVFAKAQLISPGIDIGYGGFTTPVTGGGAKSRTDYFSDGTRGQYKVTSTGAFHAGVSAKLWRVRVGVVASYESITVNDAYFFSTLPSSVKVANNYLTVMARVQWNYASFSGIHLYGGLAGGGYSVHSKLKEVSNQANESVGNSTNGGGFAYQLSAIGVSLGGKTSVYLEAGYGYLGIVNGGVRFSF